MEMRYCKYCNQNKPFDHSQQRLSKASGFMGARCWDCYVTYQREKLSTPVIDPITGETVRYGTLCQRRLVSHPDTGEMVRYSTAYMRRLVPDPVTGEMVPYSTAASRRLVPDPGTGEMVSYSTAYARRLVIDPVTGETVKYGIAANHKPVAYLDTDEEISYGKLYQRLRRQDPIYRLIERMHRLVWQAFKEWRYNNQTMPIVFGCSFDELVNHIKSQLVEGMDWKVYGTKWRVTYKVPLMTATTEDEVLMLSHYTNLRPTWCPNKRGRIPAPIVPNL